MPGLRPAPTIPFSMLMDAVKRVSPHIRKTPLTYDPHLRLHLKWENQQVTGSFKARGALNKILSLSDEEKARGLVCASAGNHGQGVALAGKLVEAPVVVFASEHAVPAKIEAMQSLGAEVRLVPGGYGEAEATAIADARSTGRVWVSPYNDERIIAGQATLAFEVLNQDAKLLDPTHAAAWVVPVGGGGLLSGIGTALEVAAKPGQTGTQRPRLIGVQSEASPFGYHLFHKGLQDLAVELPSLADGLSGPIEKGSMTVPMLQHFLDDFILVSEQEIASAIAYAWNEYSQRIEGAAAAALASVLSGKVPNLPAVVIISGGNIQAETHQAILDGQKRT